MPGRRRRARCIGFDAGELCFKPCGRPGRGLETVALRADELEALRLADLEGLYQEESARRMGISRTTLSRTLADARRKVTDALIRGKRLIVEAESRAVETPASADAATSNEQIRALRSTRGSSELKSRGAIGEEDRADSE